MAMTYIVAYDIAANRRRNRVAHALQSWGYRIQESVFQLRLETGDLDAVRHKLDSIIDAADDVIHIYPVCASCAARSEVLGTAVALDDVGLYRGLW
ncbi:CRISPR-associated endonuclease Cas2 [Actinomyces mediterranea]|uniref:CRISPR-associated endonuclease Cas2 n=1 Tax=Actinomyces mediterranea TaxID=1871028 RepID=UPI001968926D|nr:CRISPR-associated endonuclease Cas2 [Actinomyces mediterranea]